MRAARGLQTSAGAYKRAQSERGGYERMRGCTSKHRGWYNVCEQVRGVHWGEGGMNMHWGVQTNKHKASAGVVNEHVQTLTAAGMAAVGILCGPPPPIIIII